MPIEDRLVQGEQVIAAYGDFYATDRRLMRYRKGWTGEKVDSLPYDRITSLTLTSAFRKDLIILGAVLLGIGISTMLFLWMTEYVMRPMTQWMPFSLANIIAVLNPILILLSFAGIACMSFGVILKGTWYQIKALGLIDKDLKKWRIPYKGATQVEGFARKVEEHLFGTGRKPS